MCCSNRSPGATEQQFQSHFVQRSLIARITHTIFSPLILWAGSVVWVWRGRQFLRSWQFLSSVLNPPSLPQLMGDSFWDGAANVSKFREWIWEETLVLQHSMRYPEILLRLPRAYHQHSSYGTDNRSSHSAMSVESAYRALDLEPGASMDNVKAAYRRLALKWWVTLVVRFCACVVNLLVRY